MKAVQFSFQLEKIASNSAARAGELTTAHSRVQTPVFMPVATHAAVRGQHIQQLKHIGFPILLANTYHLLLRPGAEIFRKFGGIHPFMNWSGSVLTDSGGYQLFSLSEQLKIEEAGAEFKSYIDGSKILLSPEHSIETQRAIQSDIMMVLDECIEAPSDRETTERALQRTYRWAERSLAARGDSSQALFGIVQGGCFPDLRLRSAEQITSLPFEGFAIGGVAVGEEISLRNDIVESTAILLPEDRPRYLMGVGTPIDLLECVHRGIDMFDCIIPTAFAQQGLAFTSSGRVKLPRGVYAESEEPLDGQCSCSTCAEYSRAYLHHLFKAGEFLAQTLVGIHNLTFYADLMRRIREHILNDSFADFYRKERLILAEPDRENPIRTPKRKNRKGIEQLGDYEIHRAHGSTFIRQRSSGEVMHSVTDPRVEAEILYIAQSGLEEMLMTESEDTLVLWDVGLGAATNAMAVIECYQRVAERKQQTRRLEMFSFESDLDSLRLALKHPNEFCHLRHAAPHRLLKEGSWSSVDGRLRWTLVQGDFLETMSSVSGPDVTFFDPFSSKVDSRLWTLDCFQRLAERSKSNSKLFTYSAATGVRAGLLAAGFFVAHGVPIGPKEETTVAIRNGSTSPFQLLDAKWLSRWERSQSRYPWGSDERVCSLVESKVREHPQFQASIF